MGNGSWIEVEPDFYRDLIQMLRSRLEGRKETLAVVEWVLRTPRSLPVPLAPGVTGRGSLSPDG